MSNTKDGPLRQVLPVPDVAPVGLTTFDAKDPETAYPPFSGDESLDLGEELGSPVTTDYGERKFSGKVNWVEIAVGMDDHNHLISPEERLNLALAFH